MRWIMCCHFSDQTRDQITGKGNWKTLGLYRPFQRLSKHSGMEVLEIWGLVTILRMDGLFLNHLNVFVSSLNIQLCRCFWIPAERGMSLCVLERWPFLQTKCCPLSLAFWTEWTIDWDTDSPVEKHQVFSVAKVMDKQCHSLSIACIKQTFKMSYKLLMLCFLSWKIGTSPLAFFKVQTPIKSVLCLSAAILTVVGRRSRKLSASFHEFSWVIIAH